MLYSIVEPHDHVNSIEERRRQVIGKSVFVVSTVVWTAKYKSLQLWCTSHRLIWSWFIQRIPLTNHSSRTCRYLCFRVPKFPKFPVWIFPPLTRAGLEVDGLCCAESSKERFYWQIGWKTEAPKRGSIFVGWGCHTSPMWGPTTTAIELEAWVFLTCISINFCGNRPK